MPCFTFSHQLHGTGDAFGNAPTIRPTKQLWERTRTGPNNQKTAAFLGTRVRLAKFEVCKETDDMTELKLSVVIAVKDALANLPAIFDRLDFENRTDVEIILCVAGKAPKSLGDAPRIKLIQSPEASLIPHLWRDGIRVAKASKVALTTAHCIPAANWIDVAAAADINRFVAIGGTIENDPNATALNWAIFFLRYLPFSPPRTHVRVEDVAADNAVYDRRAIMLESELIDQGFWEPPFHKRFREANRELCLNPDLCVVHHGLVSAADFIAQRREHGREYGLARAKGASLRNRLVLLLRSPALLPLILWRIWHRSSRRVDYRRHFLTAFPWLFVFAFAWSFGEARGYIEALMHRSERND